MKKYILIACLALTTATAAFATAAPPIAPSNQPVAAGAKQAAMDEMYAVVECVNAKGRPTTDRFYADGDLTQARVALNNASQAAGFNNNPEFIRSRDNMRARLAELKSRYGC